MGEAAWKRKKKRPEPGDKKSELHVPNTSLPVSQQQATSGVWVCFPT